MPLPVYLEHAEIDEDHLNRPHREPATSGLNGTAGIVVRVCTGASAAAQSRGTTSTCKHPAGLKRWHAGRFVSGCIISLYPCAGTSPSKRSSQRNQRDDIMVD